MGGNERLLLIDTCGETSGLALCEGDRVLLSSDLGERRASAEILSSLRYLLQQSGWRVQDLSAVGVVRGPGSFTGVRAGLGFAKGLCESVGLRLAAVSRLEVLSDTATLCARSALATAETQTSPVLVALDAGRNQVYARDVATGREWLTTVEQMQSESIGRQPVAVAEQRLAEHLQGCRVVLCPLHARDALRAVLRRLQQCGSDAEGDANYVRQEEDIYGMPAVASGTTPAKAP